MHSNRWRVLTVMAALGACLASTTGVSASTSRGLHVIVSTFDFGAFTCDGVVCSGVADGAATSNVDGDGTIHWDMVTTFFNGFDDPCNHVDEVGTFSFAHGSFTEVSHHTDCRLHGWRVKTTFTISGGTGIFAGATGGGLEEAGPNPFQYNGTIRS